MSKKTDPKIESKNFQPNSPKLSEQWKNIQNQIAHAASHEALVEFAVTAHAADLNSINSFSAEVTSLQSMLKHAHALFEKQSLLAAYLTWTKYHYFKIEAFDYPKLILQKNIIPFKNNSGRLLLIQDLTKEFFVNILEAVRCRRDLSLHLKEAFVYTVLDFNEWFCQATTFGKRFEVEDPDRLKTAGRLVAFDDFIELLCNLDKRCQLVAKLLYFGGSRTLEQVITLQIEDVQFDAQEIIFDGVKIGYPKHIFEDILSLIDGRPSGNVFEGRQNTSLNAATIFRNFKEAASRIPLGDSFSPKSLTTNA